MCDTSSYCCKKGKRGKRGHDGMQGPVGPQGPQGMQGPPGQVSKIVIEESTAPLTLTTSKQALTPELTLASGMNFLSYTIFLMGMSINTSSDFSVDTMLSVNGVEKPGSFRGTLIPNGTTSLKTHVTINESLTDLSPGDKIVIHVKSTGVSGGDVICKMAGGIIL